LVKLIKGEEELEKGMKEVSKKVYKRLKQKTEKGRRDQGKRPRDVKLIKLQPIGRHKTSKDRLH